MTTAPRYTYRRRAIADLPPAPPRNSNHFWADVRTELQALPTGEALFFDSEAGADKQALQRLTERARKGIKVLGPEYRVQADIAGEGVWLYRNGAGLQGMGGEATTPSASVATPAEPAPPVVAVHVSSDASPETLQALDEASQAAIHAIQDGSIEASSNGRTPAFGAEGVGSTPAASASDLIDIQITRKPCTCSEDWRAKAPRFQPEVRNEAHHPDCPWYRRGAHNFPLPSAIGNGVDVKCLWCDEVRHFEPTEPLFANEESGDREIKPAKAPRGKGGREAALIYIRDNPGASAAEIARGVGVTTAMGYVYVRDLTQEGLIEPAPSQRNGPSTYRVVEPQAVTP